MPNIFSQNLRALETRQMAYCIFEIKSTDLVSQMIFLWDNILDTHTGEIYHE